MQTGNMLRSFFVRSTHKIHRTPLSSTHIIIAPFVVLVFSLYVDGKLGQEGALERIEKTRQWEIDMQSDNFVEEVEDFCQLIHMMGCETNYVS